MKRIFTDQVDSSQSVHGAMTKHLEKIKGFSEVKIAKVKDAVRKCLVSHFTCWFWAMDDLRTDKTISM